MVLNNFNLKLECRVWMLPLLRNMCEIQKSSLIGRDLGIRNTRHCFPEYNICHTTLLTCKGSYSIGFIVTKFNFN
jgi:hypothetical protein